MNALPAALAVLTFALPSGPPAQDPVQDVVEPLFEAVAAEDLESASAYLVEGAMIHAMFNPDGTTGEGSVRSFPAVAYFQVVTTNYENIVFEQRTYSVADAGKTVWMEANGDLKLQTDGSPYRNRYVFKITLDDESKITEIREWVNTVTLTQQGVPAR
ncbi:MAG: hypothetical protein AAGK22_13315 [Acidobacteriota bacterium]